MPARKIKKHGKHAGYVAERPVKTGEVVLYDGYAACKDELPNHKDRWVIQHFPSGNLSYFRSKRMGMEALNNIAAGFDRDNIAGLSEVQAISENARKLDRGATTKLGFTLDEIIEEEAPVRTSIQEIWKIANEAVCSRKVGEDMVEGPDYAARFRAHTWLVEMRYGKASQKTETVHRREEVGIEELMDRAREKPEWARGLATIFSKIADSADTPKPQAG